MKQMLLKAMEEQTDEQIEVVPESQERSRSKKENWIHLSSEIPPTSA